MKKMILAALILAESFVHAVAEDRWVRVDNLELIDCHYSEHQFDWGDHFEIEIDGTLAYQEEGSRLYNSIYRNYELELHKKLVTCKMSIFQAKEDKTPVMVNLRDGNMLPLDGFFQRIGK